MISLTIIKLVRNKVLTANLLREDIIIINFVRRFQNFIGGGVSKYNVGLKTLLLQGLSEPEFYDDLVSWAVGD